MRHIYKTHAHVLLSLGTALAPCLFDGVQGNAPQDVKGIADLQRTQAAAQIPLCGVPGLLPIRNQT